ncbi:MAG: cell division ATP-binding protein FtsE [Caryophanon sp.]|nr:cell division ATP-binding protein FtsE [Caryophanon sp.]
MIEMQDVYKKYDNGMIAVKGISVKINKGEFVYVVGPSGAGKTTFIKLMYREERATKGSIIVNNFNVTKLSDQKVPQLRRQLGVVYQDFKLLPKLTVYENVAFALEVTEAEPKVIRKRVAEVLQKVGLTKKAKHFPQELSGGEQQRVAIARAIVNKPAVLIADEPTGNLDPDNAWSIMDIFNDINQDGTTIVMATHNKDIVNTMRRRVIAVEDGVIVRDEYGGDYGYEH